MGAPLSVNMIVPNQLFATLFMAFYALDEDDLIHVSEVNSEKIYHCPECFGPVKRRKGLWKLAHFYHIRSTPQCRLYSKSVDHLVAQVELQRQFPEGIIQMERPFPEIARIADLCWEQEKIVFEIQCSPISEKEAEMRMHDYESVGYEVVWLLDDRRYNKRILRPAEGLLRIYNTYFLSIAKRRVYDQFEHFSEKIRVRKSRPMRVDLRRIFHVPKISFSEDRYPKQILQLHIQRYFLGDRFSAALHFPLVMLREKGFERQGERLRGKIWEKIGRSYAQWLDKILKNR